MIQYSGIRHRRVLITGATNGLGFAMAKALVSEAARVFVTGRDRDRVNKALAELRSLPGECQGAAMDVRDEQSIRAGLAEMLRIWGGIDVLINNAGIGMRTVSPKFLTDPKLFWEIPAQGFRNLIDTNLTGYFLVAKEVVPHFLKAGRGRIINISMNHETMRRRGFIPYGPSRAATESLSHIMAQDLGSSGVTVNLLLPGGATTTGMIPDEVPASMRPQILSPDVMAEPVVFLCSDEAQNINDQRIVAKEFARWKEERTTSGTLRVARSAADSHSPPY
jgi:NAD(P)-dependent dehydrogenase (short-subunit alcohol dehydrogenase family)